MGDDSSPEVESLDHTQNSTQDQLPEGISGVGKNGGLRYVQYDVQKEHVFLAPIRQLISKDLSEPYSIYVYRYFLNQWGDLCYMALDGQTDALRGVVICKLETHRSGSYRGYIAMLAVVEEYRGRGIAKKLVRLAIDAMSERGADEITLETECSNTASLRLYEGLGFLRSKKLHRYYLNGNSAFRLQLYLKEGVGRRRVILQEQKQMQPVGQETAEQENVDRPLGTS